MAKRKSNSWPSAATVAELATIREAFANLLANTGVDAREMRGDLGKILDLYFDLCHLVSRLSLRTDPHLRDLYMRWENFGGDG